MYDLSNENRFVPIDHQYIFNSSNLEDGLSYLTYYDSILAHEVVAHLLKKSETIELNRSLDKIEDKYYFYIGECKNNLNSIMEEIPEDWNINTNNYVQLLENHLFNNEWIKDRWEDFKMILLSI